VPPGNYQVKLTAGGNEYTAPLVIQADPRVKVSQADFEKQYAFALELSGRVTEVHTTVNEIRAERTRLDALEKLEKSDASKTAAIERIKGEMSGIEEQLIQVASVTRWAGLVYPIELDAQYGDLMNVVESADSAPPAQVYEVFNSYEAKRKDLMSRWNSVKAEIAQVGGR